MADAIHHAMANTRARRLRRVTLGKAERAFSAVMEIVEADDYRDVIPSRYQDDLDQALETLSAVQEVMASR